MMIPTDRNPDKQTPLAEVIPFDSFVTSELTSLPSAAKNL
jgi:hypothetical protein